MMAIPGNADLDVPVIPNSWTISNSRRERMSEGGDIEIFCRTLNKIADMKDGPIKGSENQDGKQIYSYSDDE